LTPNTVVIRKIKRPQALGFGRHPTYELATDRFGTWLFSPKGTIYRGQVGSEITECEVGQGTAEAGRPVIHLIPEGEWWVAHWCELFIAVDVCVPSELTDGEWRFTDLELDVLAIPDGRVEVHDEDEFEGACEAGLITPEEASSARAAAVDVEACLRNRNEPFGRVGWSRLEDAVNLGLPPIRELTHIPTA